MTGQAQPVTLNSDETRRLKGVSLSVQLWLASCKETRLAGKDLVSSKRIKGLDQPAAFTGTFTASPNTPFDNRAP
jgi:hypothetical protein